MSKFSKLSDKLVDEPDELPADFAGFDEDRMPEELPADFDGFDDEELPADFAGFDPLSPGAAPLVEPSPSEERDEVLAWEASEHDPIQRMFDQAREAARAATAEKRGQQRQEEWLDHQRQIGRGWAKFLFWWERCPEAAEAYRREHEDAQGEWLIEMMGPRWLIENAGPRF
jgi:hypothetical protein